MRKCAICYRTDVRYSNEHVIPEALGGRYVRQEMVCVDCNSELGRRVDDALVNHDLSKMFRFMYGLAGKAKKPPNPFAGEHSLRSDSSQKMRIDVGAGGRLVPYVITQVRPEELGGGRVNVSISVDKTDEGRLEPMIRKIANRLGGSGEEVLTGAEKTVVQSDGEIHVRLAIDTRNYKIGLLKIAYEFAVDRIPSYMGCRDAKEIAEILRGGLFEEVERYVNIGDGLDRRIMSPFSDLLGYDGVKHYLVLDGSDAGVLCFVHLHNLFTVGVTLSTERFGEQFEIGVNDVEKGSFRVWRPEDIRASTRYRPVLHFETEVEAAEFREAERAADFDYESNDGMWKLFTHDGRDTGKNIQDVVETVVPTRTESVSGGLTEEFWFDENVYLRPSRSGKSVRVLAFRAEHTLQKL